MFTGARGRNVVFWQSPRTRMQARPNVATPTARGARISSLEILIVTREQYAYCFPTQHTATTKRALPVGGYSQAIEGRLVAASLGIVRTSAGAGAR